MFIRDFPAHNPTLCLGIFCKKSYPLEWHIPYTAHMWVPYPTPPGSDHSYNIQCTFNCFNTYSYNVNSLQAQGASILTQFQFVQNGFVHKMPQAHNVPFETKSVPFLNRHFDPLGSKNVWIILHFECNVY